MKDWITCPSCEEEFQIISNNLRLEALYCPFCAEDIPEDWSVLDDEDYE
jgi:hypothetical protein